MKPPATSDDRRGGRWFCSNNGGPFTPWQTNTTDQLALFTGLAGHTYAFYSTSRDNVNNQEPDKFLADTTTTVISVIDVTGQVRVTLTNTGGTALAGSPGASVTATLEFVNPSNRGITYQTRVLSGPGSR